MAEEGANAFWPLGQAAHVVDNSLLELPLAAGDRLGSDCLLDVAVQALVRVEVWAVGREFENLDLILMAVKPRNTVRESGARPCRASSIPSRA